MTLQERLLNLFELFGLRNAMYMRGDMRILFLTDAVRHLGKLIRKEETDKDKIASALASIFARTCACADSFVNLPIIDALCEKYPEGKCAYCQGLPCKCDPNRKTTITHSTISTAQKLWTVDEWCKHLDTVYGEANRKHGIEFAHGRLWEEVGETIGAQIIDAHNQSLTLADARRNISREFADVFAWTFTISAMSGVNLDTTLNKQYPKIHHRCGQRPCNCGPYYLYLEERGPAKANSTVIK